MKWGRIRLVFIVLIVFVVRGNAQTEDQLQREVKQVAATVLAGPSVEKLEELCGHFGARLTGTPAYDQAAQWAAAQFHAAGIQDVKFEQIRLPNSWQRGWAESYIYSPIQRKLHLETVCRTSSTPRGGVKGEVVVVSDISATAFNKTYPKLITSYQIFKALGAQALLLPDTVPNNVLGDWLDIDNGKGEILPLPIAKTDGAIVAVLAYVIAEREQVIGPHLNHAAISEILEKAKLDGYLVAHGDWQP
jgi:hypothetical protein